MSEVINKLLKCGHRYEDVYDEYTMEELQIFYEEAVLDELETLRRQSVATFNATRGTGKGFKKYVNGMERAMKSVRSKKSIAKQAINFFDSLTRMGKR